MQGLARKAAVGFESHGWIAVAMLLAWTVAVGGSSRGHAPAEVLAQLVALPLGAWALLAIADSGCRLVPGYALVLALAIACVVGLGQLPLPSAWWTLPAARAALARDLATAGVEVQGHWSLAPLASERALWSLMPALAVFLGSLAVPPRQLRRLLLLVVALGMASLLLGVLQMLSPRSSPLNPFPQWAPAFNGLFENPNHQASLLALCAAIVAALDWRCPGSSRRLRRWAPAWIAMGALALVAAPLTGSRAGAGLAIAGVAIALVARYRARRGPLPMRHLLIAAPVAIPILVAGAAWVQPHVAASVRWGLVQATAAMARDHAPFGAGTGTFPRWFDQSAPGSLVDWEYFNHAHDEYVQWWFELGVAGIACMLAVLAVMVVRRPWASSTDDGIALAGWLGCVLLLLHSLVDYPLRTPALMVVAALLAGAMCHVHASSHARQEQGGME